MSVTILGSGFAALTAARVLRNKSPDLEINLIAPEPELIYLPGLIWLPNGLRKADDLRVDLQNFFKRTNINYIQARAEGLEDGGRSVLTSAGPVKNDGLIIGTGARFLKKQPGIEHTYCPCEGIEAVEKYTERLKNLESGTIALGFGGNPKEPNAMRGGPMFEFLFGLDTQLRKEKRRDKFNIVFFSPAPEPAKRLGANVPATMLDRMAKCGIEARVGNKITGFDENQVHTEGGSFHSDLTLFMPGLTGQEWLDNTKLPRSPGGLVEGDEYARVPGFDKTYIAGDGGSMPGPQWQAKQAHAADLHAAAAAQNLILELNGKIPEHKIKHEIVCIVDSGNKGMLIRRTEDKQVMLPPLRLMHWAKRYFEKAYLRMYR